MSMGKAAVRDMQTISRWRDDFEDIVEGALARHLRVRPERIRSSQHLQDDLGLDPLDLAQVVHSLARIADRSFPFAALDRVETVAELTSVVRAWAGAPA
jgi:acyl carrier protein